MEKISMSAVRNIAAAGGVAVALLWGSAGSAEFALAADTPAASADATFTIYGEQNTGGSGFSGRGALKYQGQEHAFNIQGMTAQGTDTNHPVEGTVMNLKSLSDFPGHYSVVKHDREQGMDVVQLRNDKGVESTVRGTNEGMALSLKASGVDVMLDH